MWLLCYCCCCLKLIYLSRNCGFLHVLQTKFRIILSVSKYLFCCCWFGCISGQAGSTQSSLFTNEIVSLFFIDCWQFFEAEIRLFEVNFGLIWWANKSQKHTYFDVLTENVCHGRPFDGIFSSIHCTHRAFRRNGCVHDFSMHPNDGTVFRRCCSRNVVRFGGSDDVDSIRSPSRMSLYNLNIYTAKTKWIQYVKAQFGGRLWMSLHLPVRPCDICGYGHSNRAEWWIDANNWQMSIQMVWYLCENVNVDTNERTEYILFHRLHIDKAGWLHLIPMHTICPFYAHFQHVPTMNPVRKRFDRTFHKSILGALFDDYIEP